MLRIAAVTLLFSLGVALQASAAVIAGSVSAPPGQSVAGASAIACPEPYNKCDSQSVIVAVSGEGAQGAYQIDGLDAKRRYQVMVWNDVDRNRNPNPGDLTGMANNGQGVLPGAGAFNIALKVSGGGAAAAASTSSTGAQPSSGLAGRWMQSSSNTELVRVPVLKTMPTISAAGRGMVTSRAGGFTTVLRDEETPLMVERSMELAIDPSGAFTLVTVMQHAASPTNSCKITKREEERGRVEISGDRMALVSTGGSTQTRGCGRTSDYSNDPSRDVYTFRLNGAQLSLNRSGGRDWIFQRR